MGHLTPWRSIPPWPALGPCWQWCPGFGTFDYLDLAERNVHMAIAETQRIGLPLHFPPHHVFKGGCYVPNLKGLKLHAISVTANTKSAVG